MTSPQQPPRWADQFLVWFVAEELREEIQGDLQEAFYHRLETQGLAKAKWQYIKDVFQFFKPYAFEKYSRAKQFIPTMFDNYFKIALRNILHRKGFTTINLLGLSIGLSAIMLITLYLQHEYSYDQPTPQHEQVYRIMNKYRDQTYCNMLFNGYYSASPDTQLFLINHLLTFEEIEQACHFVPSQSAIGGGDQYFVELGNKRFIAKNVLYTNTGIAFQDMFPQKFLMGSPESAFSDFGTVVLTRKLAEQWFGETWFAQDLIGKNLTIRDQQLRLAGVIENVPGNVHYDFDWIVHRPKIPSWGAYTYVRVQEGASIEKVMTAFNNNPDPVYPGYSDDPLWKGSFALPLTDIHFTSGTLYELKPVANKAYLSTFGIVGLVIFLIILTNYTNLSVAMYADRQKELGMRKVLGARPEDISFQLLAEAILLALFCLPLCYLFLYLVLPYFSTLMELELGFASLWQPWAIIGMLSLALFTGLLSGLYPALAYAQKSMLQLFGKKINHVFGIRLFNFRNLLLTWQFTMVIGLLSITYFIYQQMDYIQHKQLGYEKEGVLYFGVNGTEKYEQLKAKMLRIPGVQAVGANAVPGADMYNQMTYKMKNTDVTLSDGTMLYMDKGTLDALQIDCPACAKLDNGKQQILVLNQTAADKLAKIKGVSPQQLIGQTIVTEPEYENEEFGNGIHYTIDGIIPDYKYFSLKYPNQTLILQVNRDAPWVHTALVRAETEQLSATLAQIKTAYTEVEQVIPFDPYFLEDRLRELYNSERQAGYLMASLSMIAILLALMGLAGMVSYMAYSKQKEIGIRKVLGASVQHILFRFNKDFMLLLGIATLIATPVAIYLAYNWLESFAYRITPHWLVVLLAGGVALLLVVLLVSLQSFKAANQHPVEVLRTE